MKDLMRSSTARGFVCAALVAVLLCLASPVFAQQGQLPMPVPPPTQGAPPPAQTAPQPPPAATIPDNDPGMVAFEKLLKEVNFAYRRVDGKPAFLITLEDRKGEKTKVAAVVMKKKDLNDKDIYKIYMYTMVLEFPANFKVPIEMYSKLNELNDNLAVGKLTISEGALYYSDTFWLDTATARVLEFELTATHFVRMDVYKILAPFVFEQ